MKPGISALCIILIMATIGLRGLSAAEEEPRQSPGQQSRSSVTLGAMTYYASWLPFWKEDFYAENMGFAMRIVDGRYHLNKSSFVYGPLFGISLKGPWSLSLGGSYGTFDFTFSGTQFTFGTGAVDFYPAVVSWKRYSKKYDAELLVNYRINAIVKFFFGFKYQGYQFKDEGVTLYPGSFLPVFPLSEYQWFNSGGLALGFLYTHQIVGPLYILTQFSLQGLVGGARSRYGGARDIIAFAGGNTIAGLSIMAIPGHLAFTLGGRLQYQYYIMTQPRYKKSRYDLFSGAYASLALMF